MNGFLLLRAGVPEIADLEGFQPVRPIVGILGLSECSNFYKRNFPKKIRRRQGNNIISIAWFVNIGMLDITVRPVRGKQPVGFKRPSPIYTTAYPPHSFTTLIRAMQTLGNKYREYRIIKAFLFRILGNKIS